MNRNTTKLFSLTFIVILAFLAACSAPSSSETVSTSVTTEQASVAATTAPKAASSAAVVSGDQLAYHMVDTGQGKCYSDSVEITCSQTSFSGQDA